jgi:hypothetical protein
MRFPLAFELTFVLDGREVVFVDALEAILCARDWDFANSGLVSESIYSIGWLVFIFVVCFVADLLTYVYFEHWGNLSLGPI